MMHKWMKNCKSYMHLMTPHCDLLNRTGVEVADEAAEVIPDTHSLSD